MGGHCPGKSPEPMSGPVEFAEARDLVSVPCVFYCAPPWSPEAESILQINEIQTNLLNMYVITTHRIN